MPLQSNIMATQHHTGYPKTISSQGNYTTHSKVSGYGNVEGGCSIYLRGKQRVAGLMCAVCPLQSLQCRGALSCPAQGFAPLTVIWERQRG